MTRPEKRAEKVHAPLIDAVHESLNKNGQTGLMLLNDGNRILATRGLHPG